MSIYYISTNQCCLSLIYLIYYYKKKWLNPDYEARNDFTLNVFMDLFKYLIREYLKPIIIFLFVEQNLIFFIPDFSCRDIYKGLIKKRETYQKLEHTYDQ